MDRTPKLFIGGKQARPDSGYTRRIASPSGRVVGEVPEGNRKDLTEVPAEVKEGLTFIFAERVEDVWKEALIPLYLVKTHDRKYDEAEYRADRSKAERSEQK